MNKGLIIRNFLRLNKTLYGNNQYLVKTSPKLLTVEPKRWFKLENGRHMSSVEEVNYDSLFNIKKNKYFLCSKSKSKKREMKKSKI